MADYYRALGVKKGADEKEIRQAFRRLARQHHPDLNPGDEKAEGKFKEINEAYGVLSDAESREAFDRYGENWKQADQIEAQQRRYGGGGGIHDPFSSFEDLLGGFPRGGHRRPAPPARLETGIDVSLEEALDFIVEDEVVEVTPKSIRLRKGVLGNDQRYRIKRHNGQVPVRR